MMMGRDEQHSTHLLLCSLDRLLALNLAEVGLLVALLHQVLLREVGDRTASPGNLAHTTLRRLVLNVLLVLAAVQHRPRNLSTSHGRYSAVVSGG